MEAREYPFFATQFHPEVSQFLFYPHSHIIHDINAIRLNRYFSDFFVSLARLNCNRYPKFEDELNVLIENYDYYVTHTTDGIVYAF